MLKFLSKLLLQFSLLFLILLLPPKISAQTSSQFFPLGDKNNICSNNACDVAILAKDCQQASLLCTFNPFCKKYTGTECCTTPVAQGGLGYDSCNQTFFNPKFACPAVLPYNGFTCSFTPPPPQPQLLFLVLCLVGVG